MNDWGKKGVSETAFGAIEKRLMEDMQFYADRSSGNLRDDLSVSVDLCPACGSQNRENAFRKQVFDYLKCLNCGCLYVAKRLNDVELDRLYGESGRSVLQLRELYIPSAKYRMERIYRRKAKDLVRRGLGNKLLDFGCSAGYFLLAAKEVGMEAHGIETNDYSVRWSREKLGLDKVFQGSLHSSGFGSECFDFITMWDVLEHVPNPVKLLNYVRPYLKPEGLLVIETSHIDCVEADYLGVDNTNVVGDVHLMHFTRESLAIVASLAGYELAKVDIFGLDLCHIISFLHRKGKAGVNIPDNLVTVLQMEIDRAGRGCYIRVELKKTERNY